MRRARILASTALLLVSSYATDRSYAQPAQDTALYAAPAMDGKSLEGTIIEEADVTVDELSKTRLDLMPASRDPEPLPPDLEARLEALSAEREAMAEAVAAEGAALMVPPLDDPDAPARMDARVRDPDRLGIAEEAAAMDQAAPNLEPVIPANYPAAE